MGIDFVRRTAAELLNRGGSTVRIKPGALEEAQRAITRDDVRKLIQDGNVYALKAKHNKSMNSKILKRKRAEGRRRGVGRRKGTLKARAGRTWEKKIRSQRLLLKKLKEKKIIDSIAFKKFYGLSKGNVFADKASLLLHMKESGIKVNDDDIKKINEEIKAMYK